MFLTDQQFLFLVIMNKAAKIILFFIILLIAIIIRVYGIDWDQGFHLHPDERAIVLSVITISFPKTAHEFFTIGSSWNPHFFAYGNFPLYLLKIAGIIASGINPVFGQYEKI